MHLNQVFLIVTLLQSLTASDFVGAAHDHVHHTSGTTNSDKDLLAVAPRPSFNLRGSSTAIATSEEERKGTSVSGTGTVHAQPHTRPLVEHKEMVTNSKYLDDGLLQRFDRWFSW